MTQYHVQFGNGDNDPFADFVAILLGILVAAIVWRILVIVF